MAHEIVELGAIELLELGRARLAQVDDASGSLAPLRDVINAVAYMEDPLQGIVRPGEIASGRAIAISNRLRDIARAQRHAFYEAPVKIAGYAAEDLVKESVRLRAAMRGIGSVSYRKGGDKLALKLREFIDSPGFMTLVASVPLFLPGTAHDVAEALKGMVEKKAAEKAQMGVNWGAYAPAISSIAVPFAAAGLSELVSASGLTNMLADLGLPANLTTALNTGINNLISGVAAQGVNAALGMLQGGVGTVAATGATVSGSGAGTLGQMTGGGAALNNVVGAVQTGLPGATQAGVNNILNSGAAAGFGEGLMDAIGLGTKSGFPWGLALAAGGLAAAVTVVVVVSK